MLGYGSFHTYVDYIHGLYCSLREMDEKITDRCPYHKNPKHTTSACCMYARIPLYFDLGNVPNLCAKLLVLFYIHRSTRKLAKAEKTLAWRFLYLAPLTFCTYPLSPCMAAATEVELLASVRERYTTVKRLVVRPGKAPGSPADGGGRNLVVEVQFTGPQPSEGPGALLCDLLCGTSVQAKPVELPRGRKKRARTDASSEASDSGETC